MASRSANPSPAPDAPRFRARFDELEKRRKALLERLAKAGEDARGLPAYRNALKLLNEKFRAGNLAERAALLHAAAWTIEVMETAARLPAAPTSAPKNSGLSGS